MHDEDIAVLDRTDVDDEYDLEEPKDFVLVYLNDDYSSFELVTLTLIQICHKTKEEAEQITLEVHKKGRGVGYIGPYDICKTKQIQIRSIAKQMGMPLMVILEEC